MKKSFISLVAAGVLSGSIALVAGSAQAATPNGFSLSAGYAGNHVHYTEQVNPSDKETGWFNGGYLSAQNVFANKHTLGRFFVDGSMSYQMSKIKYDGALQDGTPYKTKNKEYKFNGELKAGVIQNISSNFEMREYGLMGYHNWERKLHGQSNVAIGYNENYHWVYTGLGIGADYFTDSKLSFGLRLQGMLSPIESTVLRGLTSDVVGKVVGSNVLYAKMKLGTVYGYHAELPVSYKVSNKVSVGITPFYTYWHISNSNKEELLYEPSSKTKDLGASTGVTYSF